MIKEKFKRIIWFLLFGGLFISNSLIYVVFSMIILVWVWDKSPFGRIDLFFYPEPTLKAREIFPVADFKKWIFLLLFFFIIWRLLSTVFSISIKESLLETGSLGIYVMFFIGQDFLMGLEQFKKMLFFGLATATFASVWAIYKYVMFLPDHAEGFYGGYSQFATLLAMNVSLLTSFFLLEENRQSKVLIFIALLSQGLALILTRERGPWLGAMAGFFITGWLSRKKGFWRLAVVLSLLIIIVVGSTGIYRPIVHKVKALLTLENSGRIILWKAAFKASLSHPFLGYGPHTFRLVCMDAINQTLDRGISGCHNEFLQFVFESGWPVLLFYLGFWILFLKAAVQIYRFCQGSEKILAGGYLGLFISHVIMSFFGTGGSDMVMIYLLFFMGTILAFKESQIQPMEETKR